nr:Chain R, peptide [synthetic construct]3K48_S Chain S, peptide [synthetic construct]3K48_T Chain T, peptide [synthetic construct]
SGWCDPRWYDPFMCEH